LAFSFASLVTQIVLPSEGLWIEYPWRVSFSISGELTWAMSLSLLHPSLLLQGTYQGSRSLTTAHEVSRRFPTAAFRVRACGICGGQSGIGAGFLRVFRLPLPILILLHTHPSFGAGRICQILADIPRGLSPTPPQELTN
jgi:hypothetical protein